MSIKTPTSLDKDVLNNLRKDANTSIEVLRGRVSQLEILLDMELERLGMIEEAVKSKRAKV